MITNILNSLTGLTEGVSRTWYGIECYKEMISRQDSNRNQAEWAGFYWEMSLDHLLKTENVKTLHKSAFDLVCKDDNGFCFDGDAKCHTQGTTILLNDKKKLLESLNRNGQFLILVLEHTTVKDGTMMGVTFNYWNNFKPKKSTSESYRKKMKYSVTLTDFKVMVITPENVKYLSDFNQGHNSDKKKSPRSPKLGVSSKNEHHFLVHHEKLALS
jgi:hypothetical protein